MEKLDSVLPTYHGMVWPVSTWTAWLVCIEALVEINAVLVSEMFHEVVVMLLELRVWTGVEVSNFTPGAVTFTWTSSRLLSSRISSIVSSGSMMNERVVEPAV